MSAFEFDPRARDYSPANAYSLALLSDLAYSSKGVVKRRLKSWGFDEDAFDFFDRGDTQAFVTANDDCVLLAFRGTEQLLADWLSDLHIHLTGGPLGKVHEGFAAGLNAVWLDVLQALRDLQAEDRDAGRPPRTLWVTGHSLGAALATLAVAKLIERAEPVDGLYTYGSPRCGDADFSAAFDARFSSAYRIVNRNDVVTRVPLRPLYRHVGTVKYIDDNGVLRGEDGWQAFLRSARYAVEDLQALKVGAVKDHLIDQYTAALDKLRAPAVAMPVG